MARKSCSGCTRCIQRPASVPGNAISQTLYRRLRSLGLANQSNDSRKQGLFAHARGLATQRTRAIGGGSEHLIAGTLAYRHTLTGQHASRIRRRSANRPDSGHGIRRERWRFPDHRPAPAWRARSIPSSTTDSPTKGLSEPLTSLALTRWRVQRPAPTPTTEPIAISCAERCSPSV